MEGVSRPVKPKFGSKQIDKKEVECYQCKKKYYIKAGSPKLKAKQGKLVKSANSDAIHVAKDCDEEIVLPVTSACNIKWIFYSHCSYHMSHNRGWFSSYKKLDGGLFLMDNNATCKIVGK